MTKCVAIVYELPFLNFRDFDLTPIDRNTQKVSCTANHSRPLMKSKNSVVCTCIPFGWWSCNLSTIRSEIVLPRFARSWFTDRCTCSASVSEWSLSSSWWELPAGSARALIAAPGSLASRFTGWRLSASPPSIRWSMFCFGCESTSLMLILPSSSNVTLPNCGVAVSDSALSVNFASAVPSLRNVNLSNFSSFVFFSTNGTAWSLWPWPWKASEVPFGLFALFWSELSEGITVRDFGLRFLFLTRTTRTGGLTASPAWRPNWPTAWHWPFWSRLRVTQLSVAVRSSSFCVQSSVWFAICVWTCSNCWAV